MESSYEFSCDTKDEIPPRLMRMSLNHVHHTSANTNSSRRLDDKYFGGANATEEAEVDNVLRRSQPPIIADSRQDVITKDFPSTKHTPRFAPEDA